MLFSFLELWALLIISATYYQFKVIKLTYLMFKRDRCGLYVYHVMDNLYVYTELPTDYAAIVDPDMIVQADGAFKFYNRLYLHKSLILTFFPLIPGIAYFLLRSKIRRCSKIDKYLIKDDYVNELKLINPAKSRRS